MGNLVRALAWLIAAHTATAQLVSLPPEPNVSALGLQLIYDFEVGGGKSYYDRFLRHPEWPGAASGVTIGVGYDLGYSSEPVVRLDWRVLRSDDLDRLAEKAGITGTRAKAQLASVRDILVSWPEANGVFKAVTLARFWELTRRTYPGFDNLRPNAQAALLSLVFNRGSSLVGGNRREMRTIKDLVGPKNYSGMAQQIRSMSRIWRGTSVGAGLIRRREAEAELMETP